MKKFLLSLMVLGVGSAFATSAEQSQAMSVCMKKGGTQAQCQQAGQEALAKEQAQTNTGAQAQAKAKLSGAAGTSSN